MTDEELAEGRRLLERSQHSRWFAYFSTDQCKATLQVPEGWVFEASGARGTMEEAESLAWLRNNGPTLLAAAERERQLEALLNRCLPYVEAAALMDADITRFAPLPPGEQAKHDSTESEAERLLPILKKLLGNPGLTVLGLEEK